jgi:Luciferase-like monooxygenase
MKIAIGLPNSLPRTSGPDLIAWAREAEEHGFSSLGTIGRVVYDSHEELVALAACAAVTSRIGLATTLLVSPVRELWHRAPGGSCRGLLGVPAAVSVRVWQLMLR